MTEGSAIAARAPAVVAIVVTTDPGPWFAETLEALAAQNYENFSVLVLVSGGAADPTKLVASRLPEAFVRRLPEACGFGAAVDEALSMVEGASFFLLCHDDCAPAPDALHLMVEESFRSNAGIVCPKMVHWDDPRALLHVGQSADKTGAVVERVQDGEIDAGQHDAVRDVFVAPGGCTLVRGDLLRALAGYDTEIVAMGEDLDLSWRAHVAGARVVVAPAAAVRHMELVASGRRTPPASDAPSLQALQRRHELHAVFTGYSWPHLLRVVPQAFALAVGEVVIATLAGDRRRARAVLHAWRWNLGKRRDIRRRRAGLASLRAVGDAEIRSLQVRGSARLSTYFSRLTHQGFEVAHGLQATRRDAVAAEALHGGRARPRSSSVAVRAALPAGAQATSAYPTPSASLYTELTGSIGVGFSEDADFDDLDDLGRRGRKTRTARSAGFLSSRRSRLVAWLLVVLVLVVGSRNLIGAPTPLVGQLVPFPSWTTLWHQFFSSWQPAGTGSQAPESPAFAFLGIVGTVLFGRSGLLQQVVVLGCFPLGAWGITRLLRPFGSPRGRLAATVAYLALPLAFDALARGRWDSLVAYAATPWLVLLLARATGLEPFNTTKAPPGDAPHLPVEGVRGARWCRSFAGRVVALGALEAVAMTFAPAMVVVVVVAGLGITVGSLVGGGARRGARAFVAAVGGTFVAAILCAPWVVGILVTGHDALGTLGLATNSAAVPGWGGLLRMAVGPVGGSPLSWLLPAAGLPVLVLARGPRLAWAIRLWAIAVPAWLLALVAAKGWAVPFAPSVDVLLVPAAVAVSCGIGLGVAAFETDLVGYGFGWRQGVAVLSVAALAGGVLPALAEAGDGRWGQPVSGYQAAAGLPEPAPGSSGFRVLWLGDPQSLPAGGWSLGPGLAYATSTDGTPTLQDLWPPASPARAGRLADQVRLAMRGETVTLGRALAAERVRYVVVVTALAPHTPGSTAAPTFPVPSGLLSALARQDDLRTVPVSPNGLTVFENTVFSSAASGPPVTSATGNGASRVVDPLGAALELLAWAVVAGALLGRRRWLDWWWSPIVRARKERRGRRRLAVVVEVDAAPGVDSDVGRGPVEVPELVGAPATDPTPGADAPVNELQGET